MVEVGEGADRAEGKPKKDGERSETDTAGLPRQDRQAGRARRRTGRIWRAWQACRAEQGWGWGRAQGSACTAWRWFVMVLLCLVSDLQFRQATMHITLDGYDGPENKKPHVTAPIRLSHVPALEKSPA